MSDLGCVELTIYFAGWIGTVLYSMYHVYLIDTGSSSLLSKILKPGWSWVNRKVDTSDSEWSLLSPLLLQWLKFVVFYLVVNQFLTRNKFPRLAIGFSLGFSFSWLWFSVGLPLSLFLLAQPFLFISVFKLFRNSMIAIWVLFLSIILVLNKSPSLIYFMKILSKRRYIEQHISSYILVWTLARIISYVADTKSCHQKYNAWNLVNCYHYCFYLPLLPSAPLILYQNFKESVEKTPAPFNWSNLFRQIVQVARFCFWWLFHELALHFFYHTAVQYDLNLVQILDVWSTAGLGYTLAQFFMIKYVVLYGLPSAFAHMDQVKAPPPPQCIARIHLYSKMWRDFDPGLYNFLIQYIYIPFKKSYDGIFGSLVGSALCFCFVCLWHGASRAVIWCLANYLEVCLEMGAKFCSTLPPLSGWKVNWSTANWLRFQAVFGAPLVLISCLSNLIFLTNTDVGYVFFYKAVIEGGVYRLGCILSLLYCGCHVSMAISRFSQVAQQKPITKIEKDK